MIINNFSNNTIKTTLKPLMNNGSQLKFKQALANDTFQKNTEVSNPIKTYTPSNVAFTGALSYAISGDAQDLLTKDLKAKLDDTKKEISKKYDNNVKSFTFEQNKFNPKEEFVLKADLDGNNSYSEFYDKKLNKIGEEEVTTYLSPNNSKLYTVKKSVDYRNNTSTKTREEFDNGQLALTDEVKIVKDKNNNVIRKELMTLSPVSGAYNQKYVFPDGTEQVISEVHKYKKNDNMDCIRKNMTSLDGTKTHYLLEQDDKGNKILEYKITDKNGKVLMNLNKTMERVGDNKIVSTNGDKVYETTFEENKITIQEKGKEPTVISLKPKTIFSKGISILGNEDEMKKLLQKLPADQILALADTVKVLNGINDTGKCQMKQDIKHIDTINETFSVLHEAGHAIDYRKANIILPKIKSISTDSKLRKIYTEEKDAFNKAYPNAQREHIEYFINQTSHYTDKKWGGLEEVVAETNALRDSYTTENDLAPRVQYLQQYYPKTIAYINDKLENYKN